MEARAHAAQDLVLACRREVVGATGHRQALSRLDAQESRRGAPCGAHDYRSGRGGRELGWQRVWVGSQAARVEVDAHQPEAHERALEDCPEQLLHHESGRWKEELSLSPGTSAPARRWSGLPATFDATAAT